MPNIRVICPSSSFKNDDKVKIDNIVNKLNDKGYSVSFGKYVFKKDKYYGCASIEERIEDLEDALLDDNIDIIICGRGGFNSNQLLPYLKNNYKRKKFIGMSDNTILLLALSNYLDTYLGPNFLGLENDINFNNFITILNSDKYEIDISKNRIKSGEVEGTIIAGNLCTINLLQGTKYINKKQDVILVIEDDDNYKEGAFFREFDRNLESLIQSDLFNIKCVIFGKFEKSTMMDKRKIKYISETKFKNIPVYYNFDIGHLDPILIIPINKKCSIKNEKMSFIM